MSAIALAISFGLCAGYLDVLIIVLKKLCWNPEGYYRIARDFPWSVPASHAAWMASAGLLVAGVSRLRPGLVSVRAGSWLLATLAIWGALLRLPLYGICSLVLAAGFARLIAGAVEVRSLRPGRLRFVPAALLVVLGVLAAGSTGWQALREHRLVSGLPPAPSTRNVVLIVWDTVRAYNLGLYGYPRATTPNLARWATKGVKYQFALAPAPWTYLSHACFFTGQWPLRTNSQWRLTLNTPDSTLAEYLASRGYQTAGFVANTNSCTYEGGLARGFARFEDYTQTPFSLLARAVPGQWILRTILELGGDFVDEKWAGLQSRDARGINRAFLDWLDRRRTDRPFFAFLNLFDAHEPYIPPTAFTGQFGIRPATRQDYRLLMDFIGSVKGSLSRRDLVLARDCYDDCIAYLDEELGRLLDELERRGLLADTDVIITSDHGEAFGDHDIIGHSYSVNFDEVGVPLVILSPGAPAGRTVISPVSLRDLPATVVDRLGLSEGSAFPGRSLAVYWKSAPGQVPAEVTSPAFSEQSNATAFQPRPGPGGGYPGFQMSIVSLGHHYIRDGAGGERLFDLVNDPFERVNLLASAGRGPEVDPFRRVLLKVLTESPGSVEVERGYLERYRRSLETAVREGSSRRVAVEPRGGPGRGAGRPGAGSWISDDSRRD
jgi:arylsulfatase A-like enzyme